VNLIRFCLATPAFKAQTHAMLLNQLFHLQELCLVSQAAAAQVPDDARLLPSALPAAFQLASIQGADTCHVALSRNRLLAQALPVAALDWLLMVDADTHVASGQAAHAALRMLAEGQARGAAVIAAPVMARTGFYNFSTGGLLPPPREEFAGRVLEVDRIGTAFTAINLAWMRANWGTWNEGEPWFSFVFTTTNGMPDHISEDFVFCDGVRKRGGKIFADGRFEPVHEGAQEAGLRRELTKLRAA
jgi:hypothetical protein